MQAVEFYSIIGVRLITIAVSDFTREKENIVSTFLSNPDVAYCTFNGKRYILSEVMRKVA